ncbi:MAG: rhamnulokinase family protein [Actinomycetaceae bacterium]|nr:rhamnulokinase family protein [Actinomycetaceae bacterium]
MAYTVVAVDLGASSGRVLRGIYEGGALRVEECTRFPNGPVRVAIGDKDDLEWDILFLWNGICTGLAEAAKRGPIDAIGIDTWAVDYGLLDADGRLIGNPASYRSSRTHDAVRQVYEAMPAEDLYAHNGLQFQPFNTMFQLVADTSTARNQIAHRLLMIPDLLGYWLTGRMVCEVTNASSTGMIDPRTRTWSQPVLDLLTATFGAPVPQILPELVEAGTEVGPARLPEVELRTSDGQPTPLIAVGTHDTASAVVAVPAKDTAFGFISSGTWSLVGAELPDPVLSAESRAANFTNELGVDGTVRYLKNIMGMWVQQECLRMWIDQDMADMSWAILDKETEESESLRTLFDINNPEFLAPGNMLGRIDAWCEKVGEPLPENRAQVLRAITESLVVAYRRALREVAELSARPLEAIHIVGGGSKNRLLCQLTADATGLPVIAGPVEGTAIGNMLIQLRAIGALSGSLADIREVVENSSALTRYEPTEGQMPIWDDAEKRVFG